MVCSAGPRGQDYRPRSRGQLAPLYLYIFESGEKRRVMMGMTQKTVTILVSNDVIITSLSMEWWFDGDDVCCGFGCSKVWKKVLF